MGQPNQFFSDRHDWANDLPCCFLPPTPLPSPRDYCILAVWSDPRGGCTLGWTLLRGRNPPSSKVASRQRTPSSFSNWLMPHPGGHTAALRPHRPPELHRRLQTAPRNLSHRPKGVMLSEMVFDLRSLHLDFDLEKRDSYADATAKIQMRFPLSHLIPKNPWVYVVIFSKVS